MIAAGKCFRGTPRRRGLTSSAAAIVVALLCLAGQLLTVAHQAAERHVRCVEHGEMSHVRTATTTSVRPSRNDIAIDVALVSDGSGHEHCDFLVCSNRQQTKPILVVMAAPEPPARPASRPVPVLAPQTERILLSAPKIAPPTC